MFVDHHHETLFSTHTHTHTHSHTHLLHVTLSGPSHIRRPTCQICCQEAVASEEWFNAQHARRTAKVRHCSLLDCRVSRQWLVDHWSSWLRLLTTTELSSRSYAIRYCSMPCVRLSARHMSELYQNSWTHRACFETGASFYVSYTV